MVDSEIQDEIVELVINSDILAQLKILRLSYGTLTDKGGQIILDNTEKIKHLELLDMKYNYLSDEFIEKIKKLPLK